MSELAAIYAHLETNVVEEAANPSVDDFLSNLTAAGFDCETALAEIAKLDNRLAALASSAQIKAYAQERNSLNVDQLIAALITDYPGALQGIADYCTENNSDLPAVAGGRGSNPANLPPSPAIRPLQTRLKQITQELGERGENRLLEQGLNDAAGQQPRPSGLNDTNSDVPYRSGGSGDQYRKEELLDQVAKETVLAIENSLASRGGEALDQALRLLNTIENADPAQIASARKAIERAKESMIAIGQEAIANIRDNNSENNANQPQNPREAAREASRDAANYIFNRDPKLDKIYYDIARTIGMYERLYSDLEVALNVAPPALKDVLDRTKLRVPSPRELAEEWSKDAVKLIEESVGSGLDGFISNLEEAVKDSKAAKLVRDVEEERAPYKNLN